MREFKTCETRAIIAHQKNTLNAMFSSHACNTCEKNMWNARARNTCLIACEKNTWETHEKNMWNSCAVAIWTHSFWTLVGLGSTFCDQHTQFELHMCVLLEIRGWNIWRASTMLSQLNNQYLNNITKAIKSSSFFWETFQRRFVDDILSRVGAINSAMLSYIRRRVESAWHDNTIFSKVLWITHSTINDISLRA